MFSLLARVEKALCGLTDISCDFIPWTSSLCSESGGIFLNSHLQVTSLLTNLQSTAPSPTHWLEIKTQASTKSFQDPIRSGLCLPLSSPAELNLLLSSSSNIRYFLFSCLCSSYSHCRMAFFTWINPTNSLIQAKPLDKCTNGFYHQMRCSMAFHITLQLRAYVDSAIRVLFTNPGSSFIYLHHYYLILLTGVSLHPSKSTICSPHVSLPWQADLNGDGNGFPSLCLQWVQPTGSPVGVQRESSQGIHSPASFCPRLLPLGRWGSLSLSSCSATFPFSGSAGFSSVSLWFWVVTVLLLLALDSCTIRTHSSVICLSVNKPPLIIIIWMSSLFCWDPD